MDQLLPRPDRARISGPKGPEILVINILGVHCSGNINGRQGCHYISLHFITLIAYYNGQYDTNIYYPPASALYPLDPGTTEKVPRKVSKLGSGYIYPILTGMKREKINLFKSTLHLFSPEKMACQTNIQMCLVCLFFNLKSWAKFI